MLEVIIKAADPTENGIDLVTAIAIAPSKIANIPKIVEANCVPSSPRYSSETMLKF